MRLGTPGQRRDLLAAQTRCVPRLEPRPRASNAWKPGSCGRASPLRSTGGARRGNWTTSPFGRGGASGTPGLVACGRESSDCGCVVRQDAQLREEGGKADVAVERL